MRSNVTFDRPVTGKLIVQLDNGDTFEPTDKDLRKFGLIDQHDAYMRFHNWLTATLRAGGIESNDDLIDTPLNPLRYAVECAVNGYSMPVDDEDDTVQADTVALARLAMAAKEDDR